jgi:putative hemolysin
MSLMLVALLVVILAVTAYVDRVYSEMGKFLAREYQDNIDSWEERVEPRLKLGRESIAQSASVLRQLSLSAIALIFGLRLCRQYIAGTGDFWRELAVTLCELVLIILLFDRLVPQVLFTRTHGGCCRRCFSLFFR